MSHSQPMRDAIQVEDGPESDCRRSLLRLLDSKIIPQLSSVHEQPTSMRGVSQPPGLAPTRASVASFALSCCSIHEMLCMKFVGSMLEQGYALNEILESLVAPAARFVGEEWDQDHIDFSTVALGLMRMQNITHHFAPQQRQRGISADDKFSIVLAALPGTWHLLGLTMVKELFTNDGWDARLEMAVDTRELRQQWQRIGSTYAVCRWVSKSK